MNNHIFDSIGDAVTSAVFSIKEHAPEIEFWGGLGLFVAGAGIAIYQCVKRVPKIKEDAAIERKKLDIRIMTENLSDDEITKEKRKIVLVEFKNYIKAFALPTALVVAGGTSEILGFLGEKQRYEVTAANLASMTAAFASYRKRNAELIGEEKEKALYYGAEIKKIKEKVYDENGNVIGTETKTVLVKKQDVKLDPYTYEFSPETTDHCREEDDMYEYNLAWLIGREKEWNHIFLDFDTKVVWLVDILRALGLEEEARLCSRNVGWLNPKFFNIKSDGCINFRIQPIRYIASDGIERWKFMLDFNCDGDVYEIAKAKEGAMAAIGNTIP